MSKKKNGVCHLCGKEGELTFEHIPPKAAFNQATINSYIWGDVTENRKVKGKPKQGGFGEHTLCPKCNNDTGGWYSQEYVRLSRIFYDVTRVWDKYNVKKDLLIIKDVYPLRFIKQIATCFISILPNTFSQNYPDFAKFLLDKESQNLPKGFRFFINLCKFSSYDKTYLIHQPFFGHVNPVALEANLFSIIQHPPFQLMMTMDNEDLSGATEITQFTQYKFDENIHLHLFVRMVDSTNPMPERPL